MRRAYGRYKTPVVPLLTNSQTLRRIMRGALVKLISYLAAGNFHELPGDMHHITGPDGHTRIISVTSRVNNFQGINLPY